MSRSINPTFKKFKENWDKLSPDWSAETKEFVDWCWSIFETAETDATYWELNYKGIWPNELPKEELNAWKKAQFIKFYLETREELKLEIEKLDI